jgi:predicted O-methyltransferase YrrM
MDTAQERWDAVDDWIESQLVSEDSTLRSAVAASIEAGLPPIQVSPAQGRMLELLVRMTNARTLLEVGTLGGYSTI